MTKKRKWHPVFAKGPDGALVGIRDVVSGLKCNCSCGKCGNPVVAHKGPKNAWHFQHYAKTNCSPSPESELHLFAKEILAQRKFLWLPARIASVHGKSHQLVKVGRCSFATAEIELTDGNVTPDLILTTTEGKKLRVEIYVRHKCDVAKITKLKARALDTIEIDLSHINWDDNPEDWIEPILRTAPRKWLHNNEVSKFEQEQADAFCEKVTKLGEAWVAACENRSEPNASLKLDHSSAMRSGRYFLVDFEVEGDSCFLVERKFWQASLVRHLFFGADVLQPKAFRTQDAVSFLIDHIGTGLAESVEKDIALAVRNDCPAFRTPWDVVNRYLRHLRDKHFYLDQPDSKTWKPSARAVEHYHWNEGRLEWIVEVSDWLDTILENLPASEFVDFDRLAWLEKRSWDYDDDDLPSQLHTIRSMIIDGKGIAYELLDLPLQGERNRREEMQKAEAERIRAEHLAEQARLAPQRRRKSLEALANQTLGSEAVDWLKTQIDYDDARTPDDLSAESDEGLELAKSKLDAAAVELAARRKRAIEAEKAAQAQTDRARRLEENSEKLLICADRKFGRRDKAEAWCNSSNPKTGGLRPTVYCDDEAGLRRCLEVLEAIKV
jgi:Competence protein CoiA-like family/Protein of unknown function (DUF2384)